MHFHQMKTGLSHQSTGKTRLFRLAMPQQTIYHEAAAKFSDLMRAWAAVILYLSLYIGRLELFQRRRGESLIV